MRVIMRLPGKSLSELHECVDLWNRTEGCKEVAVASVTLPTTDTPKSFGFPIHECTIVLTSIGIGVAANAVYDAVKLLFTRKKQSSIIKQMEVNETMIITVIVEDPSDKRISSVSKRGRKLRKSTSHEPD